MALLFMDSFGYADAASHDPTDVTDELSALWDGYTAITITEYETGADGRRCYASWNGSQTTGFRTVHESSATDTFVIGFALYLNTVASSQNIFFMIAENGSTVGALSFNSGAGKLRWVKNPDGNSSSDIASTCDLTLSAGVWYYIEMVMTIDNSTGSIDWYVDDTLINSFSGDTVYQGNDLLGQLRFGVNSAHPWNTSNRIRDVYILEGSSRYGPVNCWYQEADAAGSAADFTPNTGTNHAAVDDNPDNDGDSTYNESSAINDRDSLTHSNSLTGDPLAMQPFVVFRSVTDTQLAELELGIDSNGSESSVNVSTSSSSYGPAVGPIVENDPDTASAWTAAGAEAAETYYERAS